MDLASFIANLGVDVQQLVLIITSLGSIIFMSRDFRLGILILFFLIGMETLVFYKLNYDITIYVYAVLLSFILLIISILISFKRTTVSVV
ncbi:MAG: hypothetical protein QW156_04510 [Candidatus Aenigmatarchaeota archaeon]